MMHPKFKMQQNFHQFHECSHQNLKQFAIWSIVYQDTVMK